MPMLGDRPRVRIVVSGVVVSAALVAAVSAVCGAGAAIPAPRLLPQAVPPPAASAYEGTLPVVAEYRYRIAGKIRPLLFFWISKDDVGGARIRLRRGEHGASGLDLLIGSDPARAPRRINRWGFILEESHGEDTTVVGVMKKSDEDTLDEAKSNVAREAQGQVVFKMIQATVNQNESVSRVTVATVPRDFSYRELNTLMAAIARGPSPPKVRRIPVPPGGRPGLLTAISELLNDGVEAARRTGRAPGRQSLAYAYYAKQYDVVRTSTEVEKHATYGGVSYPRVLRADFELRARGESWTERFTIVCGIDGQMADLPVFVSYQPRWWLAVEMVLDHRETF